VISIVLKHAPDLGIQAKRIAFGVATGTCSDQLIDAIMADFVQNNVDVIDRQHLQTILNEHNFSLSGYVDQKTTSDLGKILGPAALIFVKVQRCVTEQKPLYQDRQTYNKNNPVVRVYISRTQAFFTGSIQVVDLATGRIFSLRTLQSSPSRQNESQEGRPEFPSTFEVQDLALREVATTVHRMFFPWSETSKLVFFDDNDCNLKRAHQLVKAGDSEGALHASEENLASCRALPKVDPKTLGHAQYNLGICLYAVGDYDKALDELQEAAKLRPGDIVNEAIGLCQAGKNSQAQIQAIEQRMTLEAADAAKKEQEKAASEAAKYLSVADIITMHQKGLSEELIAVRIRKENRAFDLSLDDMLELKKNGLSENLIKVMLDPKTEYTAPVKK
jgi:hypothetical protein